MSSTAWLPRKWSRATRIVRHRTVPHALILMYHRVTRLESDPHLLAVTPENFASQLEVLRRRVSVIPLSDLAGRLQEGRVPRRTVVVTFDDGYADNLHEAKPLLERFEVPATVFVTAGHVGSDEEPWWDELDRILLQPGDLPSTFHLDGVAWELGPSAEYTPADRRRDRDWHIEREDAPTARHRLFLELFDRLLTLDGDGRREILERLRAWAGLGTAGRASHRTLNVDELSRLSEPGLIEIGAHSMTHPALEHLSEGEQRHEVERSKVRLEELLGTPVTSFAFPHGSCGDRTRRIVADAGFACACDSRSEPVWRSADRLRLPRVCVRDWDADAFTRWFTWWMDG
jgi:peptidoglycan/xylan/chitin deacetylase (PgdA/CDA1 family)